jgi:2,5-diamino-6-(ribosylamino)-4(3H)-pyrimidinone 5'-phosphate reductase
VVKITKMNRPRILVNVAMSADGKIDYVSRKGAAISSMADIARVDQLRASVDAVLVGGRTLVNEDPALTVNSAELRADRIRKGWSENPAKIGVVSDAGMSLTTSPYVQKNSLPLQNFLTSGPAQVYLFTTRCTDLDVLASINTSGAKLHTMGQDRVDLVGMFHTLYEEGIRSVLVEGGGTLIAELFRLHLVDELSIYVAPRIFGGASAPSLADGPGFSPEQAPGLELLSAKMFDQEGGVLLQYRIHNII